MRDNALGHLGEHDRPLIDLRCCVVVLEYGALQLLRMRPVVAADAPKVAPRARQRRFERHRGKWQPRAVDGREVFPFRQMFEQGLRSARLHLFLAIS